MSKSIKVELYIDERDFIIDLIDYALSSTLISKLKKAKPNKNGFLIMSLGRYDLEELIGNLSLEANHNEKRAIQDTACDLAERLETYEF